MHWGVETGNYVSFTESFKRMITEEISDGGSGDLTPQETMVRILRDDLLNQCMPSHGQFGRVDRMASNCSERVRNQMSGMTAEEVEERFNAPDDTGAALRIQARKFLVGGPDIIESPSSRDCAYTRRPFVYDSENGLHCGIECFCGNEFVWRIESAEYCYQAFGCTAPPIGVRPR